ncbi:hypothetical protein RFI_24480 [Reticulomyxa filosa]|uniref:Uncharacterized protein n=1 Tax=Reticulomyxa filosa TaxID=46433 RepID=X6MIN4_RETFI|nr:hypothetical protein RFI_24480 [Reticulomyxa filosa]|eukprot:ETO12895.1 hypothetical protein RFI_24480 [Reticulomyxa filosa]
MFSDIDMQFVMNGQKTVRHGLMLFQTKADANLVVKTLNDKPFRNIALKFRHWQSPVRHNANEEERPPPRQVVSVGHDNRNTHEISPNEANRRKDATHDSAAEKTDIVQQSKQMWSRFVTMTKQQQQKQHQQQQHQQQQQHKQKQQPIPIATENSFADHSHDPYFYERQSFQGTDKTLSSGGNFFFFNE